MTLGSGGTISQAYRDLVVEIVSSASAGLTYQLNADTGTNYSQTRVFGDGTTATSDRAATQSSVGVSTGSVATLGSFFVNLMGYSNTTTYKTSVGRNATAGANTGAIVGLWRSTAAITSIKVLTGGTMDAGTTVRLWGV